MYLSEDFNGIFSISSDTIDLISHTCTDALELQLSSLNSCQLLDHELTSKVLIPNKHPNNILSHSNFDIIALQSDVHAQNSLLPLFETENEWIEND